jgi:hypothetical protein
MAILTLDHIRGPWLRILDALTGEDEPDALPGYGHPVRASCPHRRWRQGALSSFVRWNCRYLEDRNRE